MKLTQHSIKGSQLHSKRIDMKNKRHDDDQKSVDPLGSKKGRMVWSLDLHQKFVDATIQIGFDSEF